MLAVFEKFEICEVLRVELVDDVGECRSLERVWITGQMGSSLHCTLPGRLGEPGQLAAAAVAVDNVDVQRSAMRVERCILTASSHQIDWRLLFFDVILTSVNRAFAIAAPHIWNTLPTDVVATSSLSTFRPLLNHFLFRQSYPDVVYWHHPAGGPCSGCIT